MSAPEPQSKRKRLETLAAVGLLALLSALAYLPLAAQFGFYNDDWYLMYAGFTQGAAKFTDVFAIDRPARAVLVSAAYQLFGTQAPWYSYSAYALRLISTLSLLWTLRRVWPRQSRLMLLVAALFAVYPGFLDQPNAVDYQSHLVSFALILLSTAGSVAALTTVRRGLRIGLVLLSALSSLAGLLLMEYYIGMEVFRFLILAALGQSGVRLLPRLRRGALRAAPYWAAAAGFLVWRMFFFNSQRAATDIGSMFGHLAESPLMRGLWFGVYWLQDFWNVTVLAWGVPLYQSAFRLRLRDSLMGMALGAAAALLLAGVVWWLHRSKSTDSPQAQAEDRSSKNWSWEALAIGTLSVLASLAPVTLGDRHILFPTYSRFTLPGSLGAVLILGGLLSMLKSQRLRLGLTALLVGAAVFAHFGNATQYVNEWRSLRNFWWQVSWRAPQIQPGTVLVADYPNSGIAEDYFVWGPANLIYYPEKKTGSPTPISLPAVVLNRTTVQNILRGDGVTETVDRRGLEVTRDYGRVLALSMPTEGSCVHLIQGAQPELSDQEGYEMQIIAPRSDPSAVLTEADPHQPPQAIFGPEPPHTWCYTYQRADLARQRGDWAEVARLGDEAVQAKLHPVDWVEWMPFIQAYAYLGREDALRQLAVIVKDQPYLRYQACALFQADGAGWGEQYPQGQARLVETFCP